MKKLLLTVSLLALLAAPSLAYVQSGQLLQNSPQRSPATDSRVKINRWLEAGPIGAATPPVVEPLGEPTRPIPEPGTMVLASLGLLALGVSRARRRGH